MVCKLAVCEPVHNRRLHYGKQTPALELLLKPGVCIRKDMMYLAREGTAYHQHLERQQLGPVPGLVVAGVQIDR